MGFVLFVLGLLWVVVGAGLLLRTAATRRFYQEWAPLDKVRRYALPAIGVGAVLILGALFSKDWFWWPLLIGGIAVAKGVYLQRAAPEQLEALLNWWYKDASEDLLRLIGLVLYSLGAALLGAFF